LSRQRLLRTRSNHRSKCIADPNAPPPPRPMLQRTRDALQRRVSFVHRLDRGASGCLMGTFEDDKEKGITATSELQKVWKEGARKTYVCIVRGSGELKGENLQERGWFTIDRAIKDDKGVSKNATTDFFFLAGQSSEGELLGMIATDGHDSWGEDYGSVSSGGQSSPTFSATGEGSAKEYARCSLVLARPKTGRWHQIRRHLNGLSHPILGDSTHGSSSTNREWQAKRGLQGERLCLHLARLEVSATAHSPAVDVSCPLPDDMRELLRNHAPAVLEHSQRALWKEAGLSPT